MEIDPTLIEGVEQYIFGLLSKAPAGLSEHALLKQLKRNNKEHEIFDKSFDDNLSLFQAHFLLFHILYRLKLRLFEESAMHLEISPLNIILRSRDSAHQDAMQRVNAAQQLSNADPLATYYLDLTHLAKTSAEDVERLLKRFFRQGFQKPDQRASALETLGLTDPVEPSTIKKRYRELAMAHHPDRGGDTKTLQEINQAFSLLMP